jgi:hypothetical protein
MNVNPLDFELKLLGGYKINVGEIPTYSIKLATIFDDIGYEKYNRIINILCLDDDVIKPYINPSITEDFLFWYIYGAFKEKVSFDDDLIVDDISEYFKHVFKSDVSFNSDYGFIVDNKFVINNKNFYDLQKVIKYRNCLNDIDTYEEDNPADERTRMLLQKRKELRKKVQKLKNNDSDEQQLTMADLISIFSEAEHMFLSDICDKYDIYQFNNQFNRLKIMDDFHVNIQALLAGAKSDDIDLQHWLCKINTTM